MQIKAMDGVRNGCREVQLTKRYECNIQLQAKNIKGKESIVPYCPSRPVRPKPGVYQVIRYSVDRYLAHRSEQSESFE